WTTIPLDVPQNGLRYPWMSRRMDYDTPGCPAGLTTISLDVPQNGLRYPWMSRKMDCNSTGYPAGWTAMHLKNILWRQNRGAPSSSNRCSRCESRLLSLASDKRAASTSP
ncbi:hypothetical protein PoB_001842700, partial [Plakobranchus ocellatus]